MNMTGSLRSSDPCAAASPGASERATRDSPTARHTRTQSKGRQSKGAGTKSLPAQRPNFCFEFWPSPPPLPSPLSLSLSPVSLCLCRPSCCRLCVGSLSILPSVCPLNSFARKRSAAQLSSSLPLTPSHNKYNKQRQRSNTCRHRGRWGGGERRGGEGRAHARTQRTCEEAEDSSTVPSVSDACLDCAVRVCLSRCVREWFPCLCPCWYLRRSVRRLGGSRQSVAVRAHCPRWYEHPQSEERHASMHRCGGELILYRAGHRQCEHHADYGLQGQTSRGGTHAHTATGALG